MKKTALYTSFELKMLLVFVFGSIVLFLISLLTGHKGVILSDFVRLFSSDEKFMLIVENIRLPRALAAFFVGGALGLSGTLMQAVLKNPLASPFTLGISQSAAFGASFAIIVLQVYSYESHWQASYTIVVCAFSMSMFSSFLILYFGQKSGMAAQSLILFGVAIGAFFASFTMLLQYFADDIDVAASLFWTFGELSKASFESAFFIGFVFIAICVIFFPIFWKFDALDLGDGGAYSLGVNPKKLRIVAMLAASLLSALSVSFFGVIGFIGLIAPHFVRLLVGDSHKYLFLLSALSGAMLLLAADIVSRSILPSIVLPVGILTSMLGAPLFVYLLSKKSL